MDCRGLYLAPGLVDTRVHTGEPGEEHKETLESAGAAAAVGGITSLVLLPDNEPPFDDASLIEFVARRARQIKLANMYAYGALTVGLEGKELAEIGLMAEAGAVAFTDADHAIGNAQVLRRALYYAKAFDALIVHLPQEPTLVGRPHDQRRDGDAARPLGQSAARRGDDGRARHPAGRDDRRAPAPRQDLDRRGGCRRSPPPRRAACSITCDTAAPYFALNDLAVGDYRTFGKLVPPLRAEKDRLAVVEGLKDGTIDAIVSDHRPQDQDSKRVPFAQAEPGGVGLETLLPISLELVHNGHLDLAAPVPAAVEHAGAPVRPARRAARQGRAGRSRASSTPTMPGRSIADELWSKTKNTPFDERPVQGRVMATIVGGRTIYRDDSFAAGGRRRRKAKAPPNGHFVCYCRGVRHRPGQRMMLRQYSSHRGRDGGARRHAARRRRAANRATTCSTP